MKIDDWFNLAKKVLADVKDLIKKSDSMNQRVIDTIDKIGINMSGQWIETHELASKQIEKGLAYQSKLQNRQYDVII